MTSVEVSLSMEQQYDFDTPATSVTGGSLRGSRCGSFSSLAGSRPSSPLCIVEQGDLGRGAARDSQRRRKAQISSYCQGNTNTLNEGIISSYSHPFYAQVSPFNLSHSNHQKMFFVRLSLILI